MNVDIIIAIHDAAGEAKLVGVNFPQKSVLCFSIFELNSLFLKLSTSLKEFFLKPPQVFGHFCRLLFQNVNLGTQLRQPFLI